MGLFSKKKDNNKIPYPSEDEWKKICDKFDNSEFAMSVWNDLTDNDFYGEMIITDKMIREVVPGIKIYRDRIETKRKKYLFAESEFKKLTLEEVLQLAFWLGDGLHEDNSCQYHIHSLWENSGSTNEPYYYLNHNGDIGLGGLYDDSVNTKVGYQLYITNPKWKNK